jgi:methionyl aminopeptidase
MIPLKTEKELEMLKASGKALARVMRRLKEYVQPGVSTAELDRYAEALILKEDAISAFKGYHGYPANICASVNNEIVHGIPDARKVKEGDILGIDLGINYRGYFSDLAVTLPVGRISQEAARLIEVTQQALFEGIKQATLNNRVSDISFAVQNSVEKCGFSVVRQFVGHGIGKNLHEEPEIPNFGLPHQGEVLKSGMVLAIEPMVNVGTWEAEILDNGWTAVTKDGKLSAHFEHTIVITENGPEILTR